MRATREEKRLWARYWIWNSQEVRAELIARYMAIANGHARLWRNRLPRSEWQDIREASIEGLIKAVDGYRPIYDTTFRTYAIKGMRNSTQPIVRRVRRHNLECEFQEAIHGEVAGTQQRQAAINEAMESARRKLKPRTWRILYQRYAEGRTLRDIGSQHGISAEMVRKICNAGVKKLLRDG